MIVLAPFSVLSGEDSNPGAHLGTKQEALISSLLGWTEISGILDQGFYEVW